jgi:phosphatidylserine decarboxylase
MVVTTGNAVAFKPLPLQTFDRRLGRVVEEFMEFGGSAVVVFGERGAWRPAADILTYTAQNIETLVRLGEPIAEASASRS